MTSPLDEQLDTVKLLLADADQLTPEAKVPLVRMVLGLRSRLRGDARGQLDELVKQRLGYSKEKLRFFATLADRDLVLQIAGRATLDPPTAKVPPGWLREYLDYTSGQESPTEFHFWVGVAVVAAALGRRVSFDKAYYRVVPNHYIVLVSPAGRCRRSVATRIGIKLLRAAEVVKIISEKCTPEGLIVTLQNTAGVTPSEGGALKREAAHAIIHAPELSVFLGRQQYNEGMIALLTTLYDSPDEPFEYTTRTHGEITIPSCALSMLGASAPDWLADSLPPVSFGGGFLSRFVFVHKESTDRVVAIPKLPPTSSEERLIAGLREIAQLQGSVVLDREATEWYEDWYERTKDDIPDDLRLAGYFERKQDHLLRLAMVLNAAGPRDLVITTKQLELALRELEAVEPELPRAFRQVGATTLGKNHERMLAQLERAGGIINHSTWLRMNTNYMDRKGFQEAVRTLQSAGRVEQLPTQPGQPQIYRLVQGGQDG